MKSRVLLGVFAALSLPAIAMAAPSWDLSVGGSHDVVIPFPGGNQSLTIDVFLNTDGAVVSGWQHALVQTAGASKWTYQGGQPTLVAPGFLQSDIVSAPIAAGSAVQGPGGAVTDEVSVFAFSGADRGPYAAGTKVETFAIDGTGLTPGESFTFSIGDSGAGFFMANATSPDGIQFGQGGTLTVRVEIPEPSSALLLLGALPFIRRRQVA
jgi:hypothetical protein